MAPEEDESDFLDPSSDLFGNLDSTKSIRPNVKPKGAKEKKTSTPNPTPTKQKTTIAPNPKALMMPSITDDSIHPTHYYACYYNQPKLTYYWGAITKTFSDDPDSDNTRSEVEFLRNGSSSKSPVDWFWVKRKDDKKDISILANHFIFYGPVTPKWRMGHMYFPEEAVWHGLQEHVASLAPPAGS